MAHKRLPDGTLRYVTEKLGLRFRVQASRLIRSGDPEATRHAEDYINSVLARKEEGRKLAARVLQLAERVTT